MWQRIASWTQYLRGKKEKEGEKIILDPIHGMIHLDPLAVKIIDTPYFQRLRYIKQLSFADFVYPGATHTRFAHSIGVYHLARQMIKHIKAHPLPDGAEKMSDVEEKCICVAALCHDLGHGPFSHAYEEVAEEILGKDVGSKLKHEDISIFLVKKMFNDKEHADLKKQFGASADKSIELIKDLIQGKSEDKMSAAEKKKKYIFQIVSNKDSGVDVDKWDYFNRDAKACGVTDQFHYDRALCVARVVKVKDKDVFELGYRDYDAFGFYNMFNTRFTLYRKVYKHRVVTAMSLMVKDVFGRVHEANKKIKDEFEIFPITSTKKGDDDNKYMKLNETNYLDVDKYLKLSDDVLLKIQHSSAPEYKEARGVIKRIHKRQLYKLVDGGIPVRIDENGKDKVNPIQVKNKIKDLLKEEGLETDVDIKDVKLNYGMGNNDPIEKLKFYSKEKKEEGIRLKRDTVSEVLPSVFQEYHIQVYEKFSSKEKDEKIIARKQRKIREILEKVKKQFGIESTSGEVKK